MVLSQFRSFSAKAPFIFDQASQLPLRFFYKSKDISRAGDVERSKFRAYFPDEFLNAVLCENSETMRRHRRKRVQLYLSQHQSKGANQWVKLLVSI
jgi:hypothetical protein